jgi:hypothetical protein
MLKMLSFYIFLFSVIYANMGPFGIERNIEHLYNSVEWLCKQSGSSDEIDRSIIIGYNSSNDFKIREEVFSNIKADKITFNIATTLTNRWDTPYVIRDAFKVPKGFCQLCDKKSYIRKQFKKHNISLETVTSQALNISRMSFDIYLNLMCNGKDIYLFNYPQARNGLPNNYNQIISNFIKELYLYLNIPIQYDSLLSYNEILLGYNSRSYEIPRQDIFFNWHGGTPYHNGAAGTLFTQYCGSKRWYFMDPSKNLGKVAVNAFISVPREDWRLDHSINITVNPGDMLIVPPFVWHSVAAFKGFSLSMTHKFRSEITMPYLLNNKKRYIKQISQLLRLIGKIHDENIVQGKPFNIDAIIQRTFVNNF